MVLSVTEAFYSQLRPVFGSRGDVGLFVLRYAISVSNQ
jgi:hypothetical protein